MSGERDARRDALTAAALFVAAFALRLVAVRLFAGEPVWDGHYYDFGARRIAAGHGYSDDLAVSGVPVWHPWCHYPVGYSAFLALFYRVFGSAVSVAHLIDAAVSAALPVVVYFLGREAMSQRRALFAGVLVAVHPGLVLYGALVMSEPLAALLTLASFLVAVRTGRSSRLARWSPILSGLVMGLAVLVRPTALLCAPLLALAQPRRGMRALGASAVLACAATLVPVLPWTARNCRVMDGCALVSTNAGWNLAIGAFPRATGRFETLRSSDGCREVTGQVQQDRCWMHYGLDHIAQDPLRWLSLVPKKLAYTFDHESFQVEYLHEANPAAWPEERRRAGRALLTAFHRSLVVLAPLGLVAFVRPRRRGAAVQSSLLIGVLALTALGISSAEPTVYPLVLLTAALFAIRLPGSPERPAALLLPAGLLATTALAHAIFFGEDRYHVVASPVLCLLVAAALRAPDMRAARIPFRERAASTSPSKASEGVLVPVAESGQESAG